MKILLTNILLCMLLCTSSFSLIAVSKVWVDSFNNNNANSFPKNWRGRGKKAPLFYKVVVDEKNAKNLYLQARVKNSDELVIKKRKIDIVKYPFLHWQWRVHRLPPNGNEAVKKYCDVAASMNVVLKASRTFGIPTPKTIKYSWSTTLKIGTITTSPYAYWPSQVDIYVMESGSKKANRWVSEKRNVLKDYLRFYKKKKVDSMVIDGIVLMSDSDNTNSISWADYDNIYFSSK